jgi:hypothetical protein
MSAMVPFLKPPETDPPITLNRVDPSDLSIAASGALSAALCLGLPAGLLFWLIQLQSWAPSTPIDDLLNFFRDNTAPPALFEMLGALGWGLLLSKISGHRQWWCLSAAAMAGVRVGDFDLYNGWLDHWVQGHAPPDLAVHVRFALILGITVLGVTVSTGLLLGLALMNWKASLMLAASTGLASVLAALVTLFILDRMGIRVGSGNAAMPKVAAAGTLAAALAGGGMLGVVFSRYVRAGSSKHSAR